MRTGSSPVPTERRLCVLSDIDGTLSVPAVRMMISALGRFHKVIFITYRHEDKWDATVEELRSLFPHLPYMLMMRGTSALETPVAFKARAVLHFQTTGYEPIVYFEDDPVVVAWAQTEGLPVISCR